MGGVGGARAGAVRQYGSDPVLDGRVRAKTGYLRDTRALSGYVDTRSGRRLAFSLLAGDLPYSGPVHRGVKAWQKDVLRLLVRYQP